MQEEINVIQHLLAVEKDAALLIDNAVKEADSRTAHAKNEANSLFKQKYDECAVTLQNEYEQKLQQKKSEHIKQMEQFKTELEGRKKNNAAFNKLLDKILFE